MARPASPPFTAHSPNPRRAPLPPAPSLPTSSSDGALLSSARAPLIPTAPLPAQPSRVKPFILRSTSPPSTPKPPHQPMVFPLSSVAPKKALPTSASKLPLARPPIARPPSSAFLTVPIPGPRVRKSRKNRAVPTAVAVAESRPSPRRAGKEGEQEEMRVARRMGSLGEMTNGRRVEPARAVGGGMSTPKRQTSSPDRRKVRQYGAVGNGSAPLSNQNSYSSLQEMLESSGFADTRVVTPTAARVPSRPTSHSPTRNIMRHSRSFSPTDPLNPLHSLKPKASLLSLFSRWSTPKPPPATVSDDDDEVGSNGTIRTRAGAEERNERAREWAERVARESERENASSPTLSRSPSVPLSTRGRSRAQKALSLEIVAPASVAANASDDDKTPTAATFAASSLPSASPPLSPTLSTSPTPSLRLPPSHSTTPKWVHSLRHVVSDPSLSLSFAGSKEYVSFADVMYTDSEDFDVQYDAYDSDASVDVPPPSPKPATSTTTSLGAGWADSLSLRAWPSLAAIGSVWRTDGETNAAVVELDIRGASTKSAASLEVGPTLLRKTSRVFQSAGAAAPVLTTVGAAEWDWDKAPAT